jgi:hypothetical protein
VAEFSATQLQGFSPRCKQIIVKKCMRYIVKGGLGPSNTRGKSKLAAENRAYSQPQKKKDFCVGTANE